MKKSNLRPKDKVLLLASYCGDDNPECTDDKPCYFCLPMCNVYELEGVTPAYYVSELSLTWLSEVIGQS